MDIIKGLDAWFSERLQGLEGYRPETIAYITGVLKAQGKPRGQDCMAGQSVVLAFHEAKLTGNFAQYQRIGDWILFVDVILPDSIKHEREAIVTIGQLSYLTCYRLVQHKWDVYEELSDCLPDIARSVRNALCLRGH